jgi:hypothetical protein
MGENNKIRYLGRRIATCELDWSALLKGQNVLSCERGKYYCGSKFGGIF